MAEKTRFICNQHPNEKVIGICQSKNCTSRTLCQKCQIQHNNHSWTDVDQFLSETSEKVKKYAKKVLADYTEIKKNKDYGYVFNYLQDSDQHLKRMEDHYKAQKRFVEEDLEILQNGFIQVCHNIKNQIFMQFDNSFQVYRQQFFQFKNNVDETFVIGTKWRNGFTNSNLLAKLQQVHYSSLPVEIEKMLNCLRRIEGPNWQNKINEVQYQVNQINENNINLPVYRNDLQTNEILEQLQQQLQKWINDNLNFNNQAYNSFSNFYSNPSNNRINRSRSKTEKIFEDRNRNNSGKKIQSIEQQMNQMNRSNAMGLNRSNINNNRNNSNLSSRINTSDNKASIQRINSLQTAQQKDQNYKISKINKPDQSTNNQQELLLQLQNQIQVDSEIICGTYLNDLLVYCTAKNSNLLNLMDNKHNKVQSQEGHQDQIIYMDTFYYKPNQKVLVTSGLDKQLIIWQIVKKNNYCFDHIQKMIAFYGPVCCVRQLKEPGVIITGDLKGEIILWNYAKNSILYAFRGQHNNQIVSIELMGDNRFGVASIDNTISIWRTKPKLNSDIVDFCVCDRIIADDFLGVTNLKYIQQDIVMLTTESGEFRLYNLYQKQVINSSVIHDDKIMELIYQNNLILTLSANNELAVLQIKNNQIQVLFKLKDIHISSDQEQIYESRFKMLLNDNQIVVLGSQSQEIQFYQINI